MTSFRSCDRNPRAARWRQVRGCAVAVGFWLGAAGLVAAQQSGCDPARVMTSATCAKCHLQEVNTWQQTPHHQTFDTLSRDPAARAICEKLGLRSVKRSDQCIRCHFTVQQSGDRTRPVSGVSCESCHGAARDWLEIHSDFGGPQVTAADESPEHARQRRQQAAEQGMRNTSNLYAIASSCLGCHTVPQENLVNRGGHVAGSADFELVAWSQGSIRHNFLRGQPGAQAKPDPQRLRLMYVVGLLADLEHSTRATAAATEKAEFGLTAARRAADVALRLYQIQQRIDDPHLQRALEVFATAELKINRQQSLTTIADEIRQAGLALAAESDPSGWQVLDAELPPPSRYR